MGEALYRKYRSKSLDEIVGQDHITTTLKNALKKGRISHAYLFTGPRGVGKTSIARILAYEINDIPYSESSTQHFDIIEIDAASNRRIDEIRELRDKVNVAPTSAKYKVYIIDEVHMLTKEAFNALLKTLEEPPEHVVFILATTEAHKLPDTIVSRTQRFSFRPIEGEEAVKHLKELAEKESIKIDDESLQLIAEHGRGSFRDSIGLLDQLSTVNDAVDAEQVRRIVGIPPLSSSQQIISHVNSGDASKLATTLEELYIQGFQAPQIARQLARQIRENNQLESTDFELLKRLLDTPVSHDPNTYLELTLLEASIKNASEDSSVPQVQEAQTDKEPDVTPIYKEPEKQPTKNSLVEKNNSGKDDEDLWQQALDELKGTHNTLYGIVRMAEASQKGSKMTLTFAFPFHQRRCNESRNKRRIEDILSSLNKGVVEVECVVGDIKTTPKDKAKHKPKQKQKSGTLDSITEVFGGGEILE